MIKNRIIKLYNLNSMEYGLNMGTVGKNYQTAPGQPSTAQGNQPNSAHGKNN